MQILSNFAVNAWKMSLKKILRNLDSNELDNFFAYYFFITIINIILQFNYLIYKYKEVFFFTLSYFYLLLCLKVFYNNLFDF